MTALLKDIAIDEQEQLQKPLAIPFHEFVKYAKCPSCNETKARSGFNSNKARPNGLQSKCRVCEKAKYGAEGNKEKSGFDVSVIGDLDTSSIQKFADIFSDTIKDLHDEGLL